MVQQVKRQKNCENIYFALSVSHIHALSFTAECESIRVENGARKAVFCDVAGAWGGFIKLLIGFSPRLKFSFTICFTNELIV